MDVFQEWVEAGHDLDFALRLVPLFTSPQFETIERDPAFRMNHTMRHGGVSLSDLQAIAGLWKTVLELFCDRTFTNWHSLIDAVRGWFHPSFGIRGVPEGYFEIREETAVNGTVVAITPVSLWRCLRGVGLAAPGGVLA